ncbi:hypothetical protein TB1_046215 [Malus domestica]
MLKLVNCMIGMVGLSMIMYSLWLIRAWQRIMHHSTSITESCILVSFTRFGFVCNAQAQMEKRPEISLLCFNLMKTYGKFIHTFLGLGITLLVTTCSGHIAAATANGCCLYLYMVFVFLLFMLEAGVTADIFLNRDWEEDFPVDPTGRFDQFKEFVRSNLDICKWIGLSIACVQVSLNFLFVYCMFVHACLRKLKVKCSMSLT